jgi:Domain of unknown function (DUF4041)/T5orf172 domain
MIYLLFLLLIGLAATLILVIQKLQLQENKYTVEKLKSKESSNQLKQQGHSLIVSQQLLKEASQRSQEIDQKYGQIISKEDVCKELDIRIAILNNHLEQINTQSKIEEQEVLTKISLLRVRLQELEEREIVEAFGFYDSKYDFQGSEEYKQRLDKIRVQQKQMIKDKQAAICRIEWSVDSSMAKGRKMTDDFIKLVLRAFNGECDYFVVKVKYNNVQTMENRIKKTYSDLNKLSQTTHCEITPYFLDLKLQELWLTHEYQERKYLEQEEQRTIREQMREEEKALRDLEKAKQDAVREERHYQEALEKARRDAETATGKAQEKLFSQIEELQKRLAEAEANKVRAISQAQLTKSGHVYIISNIGSFGENVYKIGMTRRLDPMDRVKELGDASVPFPFDVHAMIFCENAPELESRLHKCFEQRRMNKENTRKEFFQVSLDEIVKVVQKTDEELQICKSEVTFTKIAEASDYRKTLARERQDMTTIAI